MAELLQISLPLSAERRLDVVFVHGLGGDPVNSWRSGTDENSSWPHWLALEFGAQVGVWSLGYAAAPSKWSGIKTALLGGNDPDAGAAMSLPRRAENSLDRLVGAGIGQRPLCFIAHSLGGLLVKSILRLAADVPEAPERLQVAQQCRGVLFLATPHQGSRLADLASAMQAYLPSVSTQDLKDNDDYIMDLYEWYRNYAPTHHILTRSYYENKKTKGVVIVVPRSSADPGVSGPTARPPTPLDRDHLEISRPRNQNDQAYIGSTKLIGTILRPETAKINLNAVADEQNELANTSAGEDHITDLRSLNPTIQLTSHSVYFSIQFPITDLRPLLGVDTLPFPEWNTVPRANEEFVHFFGEVRRRSKQIPGEYPWQDELYYATAKRALCFPLLEKRHIGSFHAPQGGCRALYHDGDRGIVARVEAGVVIPVAKTNDLQMKELLVMLRDFLNLPIQVACLNTLGLNSAENRIRSVAPAQLVKAGRYLADLYQSSSTQLGVPSTSQEVRAGEPVVFVLYKGNSATELPEARYRIDPVKINNAGVSYTFFESHKRQVLVWFIDLSSANGDILRRLRLGLARLHAERQALLEISRAYKAKKLRENSDLIEFMEKRLGWLSKASHYGIDADAMKDTMSAYHAICPGKELQRLEILIDEIRENKKLTSAKVKEFLHAHPRVQLFLSSVSAEFLSYRERLRHLLTRPDVEVKVQEDFIVTGNETLEMLDTYIEGCDGVIHLVGDMTGSLAKPQSLEAILKKYPDLASRFPLADFLQPNGPCLSYTQWEAWLALLHNKPLFIATPDQTALRDQKYVLDAHQKQLQQSHLSRLRSVARYPATAFTSQEHLAAEVLRSFVLDLLVKAGKQSPS